MSQEFDGLVAIVTGGASGIGAATADYLSARGARVAVLDRSIPDAGRHFAVSCDVMDDRQVASAVDHVVEKFGGIDILINNAGIGAVGPVSENDDDEWRRVLDVNVLGIVRLSRAALPHLQGSAAGAIVNTCSVAATVGLPNRALYSASKGAVEALTRAMAADCIPLGIRVNAVAPGTADTPWVARLLAAADDPKATEAALVARQPMGRLITAAEVAHAIAYLASPLSASTTGTVLAVDGGMHSLRLG
jgi:NAD(P)-dependent dehydrogenase (short-subunit alcohol dehydrogenase family)